MKNALLLKLLALIFCVLPNSTVWASHEMGVQITYTCQNSCTTRVALKVYRDCAGVNGVSTNVTFVGANSGCITPPSAIGAWATQVVTEVTPICASYPTLCTTPGATINGVQEYSTYRDYNSCTATPCVYTIQWSDCCRNNSITSLSNPGSQGIALMGNTINTAVSPCNNSPIYNNNPLFYACQGIDYDVAQGAWDPDHDSLAFMLGTCYETAPNFQVQYAPGFSQASPLGASWNVSIDMVTGILHLDANPGNAVVGVICVRVEEYRNGQLVGTSQRDIQVNIMSCGANVNPTMGHVSNPVNAAVNVYEHVFACGNSSISFDVTAGDADPGQTLKMFWDGNLPGATFRDANNFAVQDTVTGTSSAPPTGRIYWNTPASGTYRFKLRVQDSYCPIYGFTEKIVIVHINNGPITAYASPANCTTVDFFSSYCGSAPSYIYWTGSGGFTSNLQNPSFTYATPGTYTWQVIVHLAWFADTVTGTVTTGGPPAYQSIITGSNPIDPCGVGRTMDTLYAGTHNSYLWSIGSPSASIIVHQPGVYYVTVSDTNGCSYYDSTTITKIYPDIEGYVDLSTGGPLQFQKVLLVAHDTTLQTLTALDSVITNSYGYYYFCDVTDSIVHIKAVPDSATYPNEMPTYADATLFFNSALSFNLPVTAPMSHDFWTLAGSNPGGPGFIGGFINQGANKTGAVGDPVPGVAVFLIDHNSQAILGYRVSDANGYLSFADVPYGNYDLVPDRPLVSTTNVPNVTVSAQVPTQDSLNLILHHYWLELSNGSVANAPIANGILFSASPNPFHDQMRVILDLPEAKTMTLQVFDVHGRAVQSIDAQKLSQGNHEFALGQDLPSGVYFVRLAIDGQRWTSKVVKL
jgi:hypothetical protein